MMKAGELGNVDPFLSLWLETAEQRTFSFNVTLLLNGLLVTGTLISSDEYFSLFAETIAQESPSSWHPDEVKDFRLIILDTYNRLREGMDVSRKSQFIHLKEAQVMPSLGERFTVSLWRGRLESVDGWVLGGPSPML